MSYYRIQNVMSYIPWRSLKHQYKESCGFLCELFVQIFKPVAHKCHILARFFTVSPSERRHSRQKDICYDTDTPNVSLWESCFIVQYFWSWNIIISACVMQIDCLCCASCNTSHMTNFISITPAYIRSSAVESLAHAILKYSLCTDFRYLPDP